MKLKNILIPIAAAVITLAAVTAGILRKRKNESK